MKIYTKTGDKGKTSLVSGTRVSKSHARLKVYGTIDELNSVLGYISGDESISEKIRQIILAIQNKLFDLGSQFANDVENPEYKLPEIDEKDVEFLENAIDKFTSELAPLSSFILPSGPLPVVQAHVARTICRRAERYAVALAEETEIKNIYIQYLNRLSDFLFVLARKLSSELKSVEMEWQQSVKYPKL